MTQILLKLLEYPFDLQNTLKYLNDANTHNLPKLPIYPWTSKIIPKISKISKNIHETSKMTKIPLISLKSPNMLKNH